MSRKFGVAYSLMYAATVLGLVPSAAAAIAVHPAPAYVLAAVDDVARPPADIARDAARQPAALIAFSGMKPGDAIIELRPGDAYWTRIFSKVAGPRGHVYAFAFEPPRPPPGTPGPRAPNNESVRAVLAIQHVRGYENVLGIEASGLPAHPSIGVPAQADVVWVPQNVEVPSEDMAASPALNAAVFRDLKPDGLFIIVNEENETMLSSERAAIERAATAAGFKLDGGNQGVALRFRKPPGAVDSDHRPRDAVAMKHIYGNTFVLGTAQQRFRTIFYHADHTYQEFGMHDMQAAYWYWDADGHNCMYHQFPAADEGFTVCHPWSAAHTNAQLGISFKEYDDAGHGATVTVVKGHQYPNAAVWMR